jgi:GT2 family glycosyltransferase
MTDSNFSIAVPVHDGARDYAIECLESISKLDLPAGVSPCVHVSFNNYSEDFFSEVVSWLSDYPIPVYVSRQSSKPGGWEDYNIEEKMANIISARDVLVRQVRATGAQAMLWVDSDMTLERDTLCRLMNHDKCLVGALCLNRHAEVLMTNAWYDGDRTEKGNVTKIRATRYIDDGWGLVLVDGVGLACVLVREPLISEVEFDYSMLVDDAGFCKRARGLGFQVWVDRSVKPVHLGATTERIRERKKVNVRRK